MADVRVTARDVKNKDDHAATTSEYIWATLRTHQIMEDYLKHNFEDRPAFAFVITRFVTNNSFKSDLRLIDTRIEKTEKELKALKSQVDKLLSKVDWLDKQLNVLLIILWLMEMIQHLLRLLIMTLLLQPK